VGVGSRGLEIFGLGVVVAGEEGLYALLQPFLPELRHRMYEHLCGEGKRCDAHAHATYASTQAREVRVFGSEYRVLANGGETGIAVHCDLNAEYGAITVLLGECDETQHTQGIYHTYTTCEEKHATRVAHPLQIGEGVIISPFVLHGVDAAARQHGRLTLNLFY
jgi:hypothetical protein